MSKPTAEQLAAIKAEFDKFDLNHDGSIDMPELGQVLRGLGPLAVMFRKADTDGDGVVSDAEVNLKFRRCSRRLTLTTMVSSHSTSLSFCPLPVDCSGTLRKFALIHVLFPCILFMRIYTHHVNDQD